MNSTFEYSDTNSAKGTLDGRMLRFNPEVGQFSIEFLVMGDFDGQQIYLSSKGQKTMLKYETGTPMGERRWNSSNWNGSGVAVGPVETLENKFMLN